MVMSSTWYQPLRDIPADHWAVQRAQAFDVAW